MIACVTSDIMEVEEIKHAPYANKASTKTTQDQEHAIIAHVIHTPTPLVLLPILHAFRAQTIHTQMTCFPRVIAMRVTIIR